MNKLLPLLSLCLLLLSSCSKYYFFSIQPAKEAIQEEIKGKYVTDNEMFSIAYDFEELAYGHRQALTVTVRNKGETPLYVNWSKSSIIVEGRSYGYVVNEKISYIPPNTYVTKTCRVRVNIPYPESGAKKKIVRRGKYRMPVQKYTFTEENSLFKFSNYLTLSLDALSMDEIKLSHDFWVSEILVSNTNSSMFNSAINAERKDSLHNTANYTFTKRKGTENGTMVATFIAIPLVVVGTIFSTNEEVGN
ncbi:MAG: hypothetical protein AAF734_07535 [Bacteroidota bacterium]